MKTKEITSLAEFVEYAAVNFGLSNDKRKRYFFRGHGSSSYELLPGVFRNDHPESDLSHDFRDRAAITSTTPAYAEHDTWLFLAQHHGLPTRLLDWSESPLIALHFALHRNLHSDDAEVFALDPTRLNKKVLGNFWFPDRSDPCYRYRFLKAFYRAPETLPWDVGLDLDTVRERELPLAVSPVVVHERMISQKAAFTIHGDDHNDLIAMSDKKDLKKLFSKVIIPQKFKRPIEVDLKKLGVTRSMVFPDLGGIAEELVDLTKENMRPASDQK